MFIALLLLLAACTQTMGLKPTTDTGATHTDTGTDTGTTPDTGATDVPDISYDAWIDPPDTMVFGSANGAEDHKLGPHIMVSDLTGDGSGDLIVGAPFDSTYGHHSGAVSIFTGPLTEDIHQDDAYARFSQTESDGGEAGRVGVTGDINCDSHDDLIVSAASYTPPGKFEAHGAVWVVFGPIDPGTHDLTDAADVMLIGESGETIFPMATGDVNGDGCTDIVVQGNPVSADWFLRGFLGSTEPNWNINSPDIQFTNGGGSVLVSALIDDVNDDGVDDVVVGDFQDSTSAAYGGSVSGHFGPLSSGVIDTDTADFSRTSPMENLGLGTEVHAGDVNGDGATDLVIGANQTAFADDDGFVLVSQFAVVLGPLTGHYTVDEGDMSVVPAFDSNEKESFYGNSWLNVVDIDTDGVDDITMLGVSRFTWSDMWQVSVGYDTIGVAYGPYTGTFVPAVVTENDPIIAPELLAFGDVTGDGVPEAIMSYLGAVYGDDGETHDTVLIWSP